VLALRLVGLEEGPMIAPVQHQDQVKANDGIEATLQRRLGSRVRNFRLLILRERLVLSGQATSYYVKQLAQHAVMAEARAALVVNNIEVIPEMA
jgi:hypothetical protein